MLPGAGFCNDALGSQAFREDRLANGVVDLVRPGVRQVLALEPHLRAPGHAEAERGGQRRRSPRPVAQLRAETGLESRVMEMLAHTGLEPVEGGYERLRHESPAERPEAAAGVRILAVEERTEERLGICFLIRESGHQVSPIESMSRSAARTAATKRRIRSGSLWPGAISTPELTSTP